jgi:glutathione S-transferase
MIDLHYWTAPNGHKITLFLEETGLPYRIVPVNIGKGEQFRADFLGISPNNPIPAIVDHEPPGGGAPISVFESGAILRIVPHERQRQNLDDFPHLKRWFNAIKERPATVRAYARAAEINTQTGMTEESRAILFGQTAATVGRATG